jgi:myo-inositol-1(or 4)-monophosphatase
VSVDQLLGALLDVATRAAAAAGEELLDRWGHAGPVQTKTSATDPVSEADRASERLLAGLILAARPDDGLVGEEGADQRGGTGLRWVVDPLDGTVNYLYGLPDWCVSVACEDAGGGLVGVVHQPTTGETYHALRGGGAWLGDRALRVNDPVPLERALIATGFAYDAGHRARQARVAAELLGRVRDIRRAGSAALDLCWVAAGRVDGYYEDSTAHWDRAAGTLIAAEAGAVVSPLRGADDHEGVVAAGPALHGPLRAAVAPPAGPRRTPLSQLVDPPHR